MEQGEPSWGSCEGEKWAELKRNSLKSEGLLKPVVQDESRDDFLQACREALLLYSEKKMPQLIEWLFAKARKGEQSPLLLGNNRYFHEYLSPEGNSSREATSRSSELKTENPTQRSKSSSVYVSSFGKSLYPRRAALYQQPEEEKESHLSIGRESGPVKYAEPVRKTEGRVHALKTLENVYVSFGKGKDSSEDDPNPEDSEDEGPAI